MQTTAIILIIISAYSHAGWNLVSKKQHPAAAFFLLSTATTAVCASPILVYYHEQLKLVPPFVWFLAALSGLFEAVYFSSLAGAYRAGDMSIAYPLARSSPIIVVTVVTVFLGRGKEVSGLCVAGILLVVAGCYILPMKRFGEFRLKNYLNACCLLALAAAFGTAGYSIADDEALRILRGLPGRPLSPLGATLLYLCFIYASTAAWLSIFIVCRSSERKALVRIFRQTKRYVVLTASLSFGTYLLVLLSLAFVANVSYVVAFRQLSIPIGSILGIVWLKEPAYAPKIAGMGTIVTGLFLVALG
ncbi:MAG TPA: multidrug DMT transporter permease [Planctomycetes bacterium]|nr:multidrug DMT transporter permease [Planctomycetota bacterium]